MSQQEQMDQWLLERADEQDLLKMDGYDDCIVGICTRHGQPPIIIYSRAKVIRKLMDQGMTPEEAEEYHEFNQAGLWAGESTPAFLSTPEDDDFLLTDPAT